MAPQWSELAHHDGFSHTSTVARGATVGRFGRSKHREGLTAGLALCPTGLVRTH
jgi:hypothetical protein